MSEMTELVVEIFLCAMGMFVLCLLISFGIFSQRVIKQFLRRKKNANFRQD